MQPLLGLQVTPVTPQKQIPLNFSIQNAYHEQKTSENQSSSLIKYRPIYIFEANSASISFLNLILDLLKQYLQVVQKSL